MIVERFKILLGNPQKSLNFIDFKFENKTSFFLLRRKMFMFLQMVKLREDFSIKNSKSQQL